MDGGKARENGGKRGGEKKHVGICEGGVGKRELGDGGKVGGREREIRVGERKNEW